MPRWVNWLLPLVTVASYLVLILVLSPRLIGDAGGLLPFDLRVFGYSWAEAHAYLKALTPAGAALYLGAVRLNDTIFPILLSLTLCLPLYRLSVFWAFPALTYGLADLSENWAVARLIRTGPSVDSGSVALASMLTEVKFAVLVIAVVVALVALAMPLFKRSR